MLPGSVRAYLACGVTHMCKGFDCLAALVQTALAQHARSERAGESARPGRAPPAYAGNLPMNVHAWPAGHEGQETGEPSWAGSSKVKAVPSPVDDTPRTPPWERAISDAM